MRALPIAMSAIVLLSGCGGGASTTQGPTVKTKAAAGGEAEPEEREPEEKLRRPKRIYAKAALSPVRGSRLKRILVSFTQRGNADTTVETGAFTNAMPGTYWLVIHDGSACGANASKAGPVWPGADVMRVVIRRDLSGGLETTELDLSLDGDAGAISHALVLHDDKKGKPGKALACGVIEEVDEL